MTFQHNSQNQIEKNSLFRWMNLLFIFLLIGLSVLLFWKCKFGYVFHDEAAYISMPYRFLQGDSLFKDEHMLTQTSAFPMLPIVKLALLINGSTEGIYLLLRYFYTAVKIIVAFLFYFRIRKTSPVGAAIAAFCFLLFSPFSIEQFSYNSLCQICLVTSCLLMFPTCQGKHILPWILSGLLFAVSVLCCPPLILFFVLWTILVFVKKEDSYHLFNFRKWLYFLIGASALAIVFFISIFSKITFKELLSSISFILTDPDHSYSAFNPFSYFIEIWNSCSLELQNLTIPVSKICCLIYLLVFAFILFKKIQIKDIKHIVALYITTALTTLIYLVFIFQTQKHWNTIMFPLNIMALFIFLMTKNDAIKRIFFYFWIPGMFYSFMVNFTSNTGFNAISSASVVSLMGSIPMIVLFVKEILPVRKMKRLAFLVPTIALVGCQVFMEASLHFDKTFADYSISSGDLTSTIESGSLKGIVTCSFLKESHDEVEKDLEVIRSDSSIQSVLYVYGLDWFYLDTPQKRNASPISYFLANSNQDERNISLMKQYYSENPEKRPDFIYFYGANDSPEYSASMETFHNKLFPDYSVLEMTCGVALKK